MKSTKQNITQIDLNDQKRIKQFEDFFQTRLSHINRFTTKDVLAEYIRKSIEENNKANELRTALSQRLKKKIPSVENEDLQKQLQDQYNLIKGLSQKQKEQDKKLASLTPIQQPFDLQDEMKKLEKEEEQRQKIEEAQRQIAEVEQKRAEEAKKKQLEEARQRVAVAEQMVEKQRREAEERRKVEAEELRVAQEEQQRQAAEKQRIADANQERISNAEQQLLAENQRLAEEQREAERQISAAKNVREIEEAAERYDNQIKSQKKAQKDDIGLFKKAARLNEQRNREEANMAEKIDNPKLVIPRQAPNQKQFTQKKTTSQKRRTRRNLLSEARQGQDIDLFDKAAQFNKGQQESELVENEYECDWTRPEKDLRDIDNFIEACQILQIPDTQFYLKKDAEVLLNTAYDNQTRNECYRFNQGNVRNNVDSAYRYLQLALASNNPLPVSSEQLIYDRNCINPALSPNNYEEAKLILGLGPQLENLMARKNYRLAKLMLDDVYQDRLKDCVDNQSIVLDTNVRLENRTKLLAARQRILHNIEEMEIARPPMEPMEMGEDINRSVPERFEEVVLDTPSSDDGSVPGGPPSSDDGSSISGDGSSGSGDGSSGSSDGSSISGGPRLTIAQTIIQMIILAKNILNIRSERSAVKSELLNNKNKLLYIIKNNITPIPDKLEEKVNTAFKFLFEIPEKLTKDPQNKQIEIGEYVNNLKRIDRQYLLNQMTILLDRNYVYKDLNFDNSRIILRPRINNKTIKNVSENVCEDIGQLNPLITSQRLFPSQIRKLTRKARYKEINKNVNARYQKAEKETERVKKAKDEESAKQIQEQLNLLQALENDAKTINNEDIKRQIRFNTRKLEELNEIFNDFNNHFSPHEREELDIVIKNTKKLKKELEEQLARSKQGGNKHFTRKIKNKNKNKG